MTNQVLAPKVDIGVRYGNPKPGSVVVSVRCWRGPDDVDTEVPSSTFVDAPGGPYPITLTAVGTDHPLSDGTDILDRVGYTGSVEIPNLPSFPTRTTATVRQTFAIDTDLATPISLICAPVPGDYFSAVMATCDNFGTAWRGSPATRVEDPQSTGMWGYIRDNANNTDAPYACVLMIDDTNGYPDWGWAYDDAVGGTGRKNTAVVVNSVTGQNVEGIYAYDYVLFEFLGCGMGTVVESPDPEPGPTGEYLPAWWGRNEARLWCQHNLPFIPQHGDHELQNDFGFIEGMTRVNTGNVENYPYSCTDRWAQGITNCYYPLFRPLQGPTLRITDTVANHWGLALGDVKFVAPDAYWHATGDSTVPTGTNMDTVLGMDQVADLNAGMNGTWNIIASPLGYKELSTGSPGNRGANWPLAGLQPTEFAALNSPDLFVTGDFHHMWAGKDSSTTILNSGTITGSANVNSTPVSGNGITVIYDAYNWATGPQAALEKSTAGFGFVGIEMTDTLRAFMVNGKSTNSFDTSVDMVYAGDGNMNKTFSAAAAEQASLNYTMDGSEITAFDAPADRTVSGSIENMGKTHAEIQQLYSDLGKEIEIIPGNYLARTQVLSARTNITYDGLNGTLIQIQDVPLLGLASYRIRASWHRDTSTADFKVGGIIGSTAGNRWPNDGVEYLSTDATEGVIVVDTVALDDVTVQYSISEGTPPAAGPAYFLENKTVTTITGTLFVGLYFWETTPVAYGNADNITIDYVTIEKVNPVPQQVGAGLSSFPSLKEAFLPSLLQSNVTWKAGVQANTTLNAGTGSFSILNGESILPADIPLNDLSTMTGDWPVPGAGKTQLVVGVFNAGSVLGTGSTPFYVGDITGYNITLSAGNDDTSSCSITNVDGPHIVTNLPQDDKFKLMAWLIPPPGPTVADQPSAHVIKSDGTYFPAALPSLVSWTNNLEPWPSMFNVTQKPSIISIYWYEFTDGTPEDLIEGLTYMANYPQVGPYPGWHAVT